MLALYLWERLRPCGVRFDAICRGTRHAGTDRNANTGPTSLGWPVTVIVPESGSWGTNDVASAAGF